MDDSVWSPQDELVRARNNAGSARAGWANGVDLHVSLRKVDGVAAYISHTSIDCGDAYELSEWWRNVLGYVDDRDDPNDPGDEECLIFSPGTGHRILFIEVPESKQTKNRMHFDIRPSERTQAEEVAHLERLGAIQIADHRGIYGPGSGWVTLADPEGNEFCVLHSDTERAAAATG
jgi:catechol 2,3-dioxygenase-like lactoylglutathione lyase family enzyme